MRPEHDMDDSGQGGWRSRAADVGLFAGMSTKLRAARPFKNQLFVGIVFLGATAWIAAFPSAFRCSGERPPAERGRPKRRMTGFVRGTLRGTEAIDSNDAGR